MDVCEVVMGTQWLRLLGPIWLDFAKLLMRFIWKNKEVELRGIRPPIHRMVDEREMKRELKRRRCGWVRHIQPDLIQEDVETFLQAIELGAQ